MIPHKMLAVVIGSALVLGGCTGRNDQQVAREALRAENARLTQEVQDLAAENAILAEQRNDAIAENKLLHSQLKGASQTIKELSIGGGANLGPSMAVEDGRVMLSQDFAFDKGSATLKQEAKSGLQQLANLLNSPEYRDTLVFVEGHTDTTPVSRAETKQKFGNNYGLSAMRAAAVVTELKDNGVSPDRLYGMFRGEYDPRAGNETADGKAKNRRVEISLRLAN
jgi:chemotaxis protein MotB